MVLEYQNKFDNMLSNTNTERTSLRDRFTRMKSQNFSSKESEKNLLKQNRSLGRKCAANEKYSSRDW